MENKGGLAELAVADTLEEEEGVYIVLVSFGLGARLSAAAPLEVQWGPMPRNALLASRVPWVSWVLM
eukprot:9388825-Pyramimonas_sp.AAC.1